MKKTYLKPSAKKVYIGTNLMQQTSRLGVGVTVNNTEGDAREYEVTGSSNNSWDEEE